MVCARRSPGRRTGPVHLSKVEPHGSAPHRMPGLSAAALPEKSAPKADFSASGHEKRLDRPPILSLYGCPKWSGSHCRIILMQNMRSQRGGLNRPPFFCTCDRADAQEGT